MTVVDDAPTRNGNVVASPAVATTAPLGTPAVAAPPAPSQPPESTVKPVKTAEQRARAQARRFFWAWLLFTMAVSIGGNVIHAWMTAPADRRLLAAIAAAVPPAVLLGATHSVALLIRTRRRDYRLVDAIVLIAGMILTVLVAACAFTMSFFSLRDLMIMLGLLSGIAWLWPVAVDLSLICSTMGLLSLTEPESADTNAVPALGVPAVAESVVSNSGPATPAERRLWWESIASVVREEVSDYRKIAELAPGQLGDVLARMYDRNESGRSISDSTGLHHREVKAIKESADGVLARTAVTPAPAEAA